MSILSKLMGKKAEKAVGELLNDLIGSKPASDPVQNAAPDTSDTPAADSPVCSTPSGRSWGNTMPDEENQFNYNGAYFDYFSHVFDAEFPEYDIERQVSDNMSSTVFTFKKGGETALIVEILASSSAAKKLRSDCLKQGIPYLRYYHDHFGWWNTRSYVADRTRGALK